MCARQAIPEERLAQIVATKSAGDSQVAAYNLCDGRKGQTEIARSLGIDPGNFSRTVARWIEAGVVLKLGDGRDATLLHVYPLSKEAIAKERGA